MKQISFDTEVIDVIQRTPHIKSFRFTAPDEMSFIAGQIFILTIKVEGKYATKHFSFSNAPTEESYIEFTKRITGSSFSGALNILKPGDRAHIRMPYGTFTFDEKDERIAFITGGIGITCVRSICKYICDMNLETDVMLLYSSKTIRDIIFYKDFEMMSSLHRNIRVVYTLTSPDVDRDAWPGRIGRISSNVIEDEIPDLFERVFYLTGPPGMVDSISKMLKDELQITDAKMKKERFLGY
jgi:ferredoxin-NADP reductase